MSKKISILTVFGGLFSILYFGGTWIYDEVKGNHYNKDGFNRYGYDKNGYNVDGFDVDGLDADGFDVDGFNILGYNREGFDVDGYDKLGYSIKGYDRAGRNREHYNKALKEILKDVSNHSKFSLKYRYKMLDYRYSIEKLLKLIIEHYKGKEILKCKDNDFLCRYIEIVYQEKLLDLTENEKESIRFAKNYFGDFLHFNDREVNNYKEKQAIKVMKTLFNKVQKNLDVQIAA